METEQKSLSLKNKTLLHGAEAHFLRDQAHKVNDQTHLKRVLAQKQDQEIKQDRAMCGIIRAF